MAMRHTPQEEWAHTTPTYLHDRRVRRSTVTFSDVFKIVFAILLPPLGVFLEVGLKGHFWLNILLTLLGYIPGIIHALYVILRH
jgi:uncharacterized membrane protein YqaE (UPF0057 family)